MNAVVNNPVRTFANTASETATDVRISVLIPFYKDDPRPLIEALDRINAGEPDLEILLHDDGEPDADLNAQIAAALSDIASPGRLLTSLRNRGRAAGRNLLAEQARGRWLLYLDADMLPGDANFLERYRTLIAEERCDAAFGGYETLWPDAPELQLHAALSRVSDQNDAASRNAIGPSAFCASNVLVRAGVMRAIRYDEGFAGWGWEDVDWAVRAARGYKLVHVDNPAGHAGLQDAEALLAKFRAGAVNYRRLLDKHRELGRLPGARVARILLRIPGQSALRGLWAMLTRQARLPMKLRTTALKLWRASWTAEALQ